MINIFTKMEEQQTYLTYAGKEVTHKSVWTERTALQITSFGEGGGRVLMCKNREYSLPNLKLCNAGWVPTNVLLNEHCFSKNNSNCWRENIGFLNEKEYCWNVTARSIAVNSSHHNFLDQNVKKKNGNFAKSQIRKGIFSILNRKFEMETYLDVMEPSILMTIKSPKLEMLQRSKSFSSKHEFLSYYWNFILRFMLSKSQFFSLFMAYNLISVSCGHESFTGKKL